MAGTYNAAYESVSSNSFSDSLKFWRDRDGAIYSELEAGACCFHPLWTKCFDRAKRAQHGPHKVLVGYQFVNLMTDFTHEMQARTELVELRRTFKEIVAEPLLPNFARFVERSKRNFAARAKALHRVEKSSMHGPNKLTFARIFPSRACLLILNLIAPLPPRYIDCEADGQDAADSLSPCGKIHWLRLRETPPCVEKAPRKENTKCKSHSHQHKRIAPDSFLHTHPLAPVVCLPNHTWWHISMGLG